MPTKVCSIEEDIYNDQVHDNNKHKQPKRKRETSNKVKSLPPVMFHTIPVALSIPISNKGDWMAFNAASLALVFPTQKKAQPQKLTLSIMFVD